MCIDDDMFGLLLRPLRQGRCHLSKVRTRHDHDEVDGVSPAQRFLRSVIPLTCGAKTKGKEEYMPI